MVPIITFYLYKCKYCGLLYKINVNIIYDNTFVVFSVFSVHDALGRIYI